MRVFTAFLRTETNTFSPFATTTVNFEEMGLYFGGVDGTASGPAAHFARLIAKSVRARSAEMIGSLFAYAQPSGRTLTATYNSFKARIVADLEAAMPVDIVCLGLHGAMATFDCDDCEGDLLAAVRAVVGRETPVGAILDPHCHLTRAMLDHSDALVCLKEYPHVDEEERLNELLDILWKQWRGDVRAVQSMFDTRMIAFYPTTSEPMASFVRELKEVERRPRILSASLAHGFPWGDVPDVGARALVIADSDTGLAEHVAAELGLKFYRMRHSLLPKLMTIEDALQRLQGAYGLVVVADVADNPGAGAPGDNTTLLARFIEAGVAGVACGCLYDPQAVDACFSVGRDAQIDLRIGGKCGRTSGMPIDLHVTVRALKESVVTQTPYGALQSMGRVARVEADGIEIVLNSVRCQTFSPDAFTSVGLDLKKMRCVMVKSTQHFSKAFAPIASEILYVNAGGALNMDFSQIPYRRMRGRYWPKELDPLELEE